MSAEDLREEIEEAAAAAVAAVRKAIDQAGALETTLGSLKRALMAGRQMIALRDADNVGESLKLAKRQLEALAQRITHGGPT